MSTTSPERICAIVVTYNRCNSLKVCLNSLFAQTRLPDTVLVVDNASTDGTAAMLDQDYSGGPHQVARLNLKEHTGGAGGITAGVRVGQCNKFDWMWILHDSLEARRDCLETMLSFAAQADMIQPARVNAGVACTGSGQIQAHPAHSCDFEGVMINRKVIEAAGLPDERYFKAGEDKAYGMIAAHKTRSIYLDYPGIEKKGPVSNPAPASRADFYLSVRNRFLDRQQRVKNGIPPSPASFFVGTLMVFLTKLGEAAGTGHGKAENAMAAIDGLKDGLYGRFDRIPR